MQANPELSKEFFQLITDGCQGGTFLLTVFSPGPAARPTQTLVWTADTYLQDDRQYYYTPNPRSFIPKDKQGKITQGDKSTVAYANAFFAEIDYGVDGHQKERGYADKAAALKALEKLQLPPTMVFHTVGHGLQVLYLLEET